MTKKRVKGRCIFCPYEGLLHNEDALPKWIGRSMQKHRAPQGRWIMMRVSTRQDVVIRRHQELVGNPSRLKLPAVCQDHCNGGWMSRLESAAIPILEPMMLDTPTTLDATAQHTLAVWFTKTSLVYEMIETADDDSGVATDADRRWFGEHQEPLPRTEMWIGRYVGDFGAVFHIRRSIRLVNLDEPDASSHIYAPLFTLVIGNLVLQSVIPNQSSPFTGRLSRTGQPFILEIWPGNGTPLSWPPADTLTDETIKAFTDAPDSSRQ